MRFSPIRRTRLPSWGPKHVFRIWPACSTRFTICGRAKRNPGIRRFEDDPRRFLPIKNGVVLGVVAGCLALSVVASLVFKKPAKADATPAVDGIGTSNSNASNLRLTARRPALRPSELAVVTGGPAAVDHEDVAVHVRVFGVGQKEGGDGDFAGPGGPAERNMGEHLFDRVKLSSSP